MERPDPARKQGHLLAATAVVAISSSNSAVSSYCRAYKKENPKEFRSSLQVDRK